MRTTIDAAGRVVIPKALRDRLGWRGGASLEIVERDGRIEIEASVADVTVVERDGLPVAVPAAPLPALTDDLVRVTLEQTRR